MPLGDYPLIFDLFGLYSLEFSTAIQEKEDGTEKRLCLANLPIKVFQGSHIGLTSTQLDTLLDFFDTKKGQLTTFSYIDPVHSVTYTVRFREPDLIFNKRSGNLWDADVLLQEVL